MDMLRMIFEVMASGWKKGLLKVMLFMTSFTLIFFMIILYYGIYSGERSCNAVLKNGIDSYAKFHLEGKISAMDKFADWVIELPGVEAVGNMVDYRSTYENLEELKRIQAGHAKGYDITLDDQLEIRCIHPELLPICEMKLISGTTWESLEKEEHVEYMYLGYAYRSIPIGTRYKQPVGADLVVAGIMEEGTNWVSTGIQNSNRTSVVSTLNYVENMDYTVMIVTEAILSNSFCLVSKQTYDLEKVIETIKEEAEKNNLKIYAETLTDIFQNGYRDAQGLIKAIRSIAVTCIFTGLLMIFCIQIIDMFNQARNIGILLSQGYEHAYLRRVFFLKDTILVVIAAMGAYMAALWFAGVLFPTESMEMIWRTVFWKAVVPAGILLIVFESILCQIVTACFFGEHTPAKLIRIIR